MDIDKLIRGAGDGSAALRFGSLMDIDKLIRGGFDPCGRPVLVL